MKKSVWIALGAVVVIAIVIGVVVASTGKETTVTVNKTTTTKPSSYKIVKACDVLTPAVATQVAGSDASTSANPDTKSDSVNVSNCSYYSVSNKVSVGLLARSPVAQDGADSNKAQFTTNLPAGAQKVSGYGDSAYWDPATGQFNILKNGTWYILSAGPPKPSDHTLAQAQAYADLIKANL